MRRREGISAEKLTELKVFIDKKRGTAIELARAQAIFMYQNKVALDFIYTITNLKKSTILKWRKRFLNGGIESIKQKKAKPRSLLTKGQINQVLEVLQTESPRCYGYEIDYWTTSILAHLIKERYNVQYKTKKPIYLLFKKAKFTYHKPGAQYRNRDQKTINEWVQTNKPLIKEYLQDPNAVVLTADEMVLSTQTTFQKIWLPKNSFPKIDVSNNRKNRSVYGFLNVQNGVEYAYKADRQNSEITCKVLDKLCAKFYRKKIVIVWDNAPWHRSKEIKNWLTKTKHDVHLIAFPPYAPELNPQEKVWKAGRSKVTHNKFIDNIDAATDNFVNDLNRGTFKYDFLGLN